MTAGWTEPWTSQAVEQAEAEGRDVRWSIVRDLELGVVASVTVDGQIVYTGGVSAEWRS